MVASAAPDQVAVVDSPVTGAVGGARRGTLTLFTGGDPAAVAVARPVLEHLGARCIADDAGLSLELAGDWTPHWEK